MSRAASQKKVVKYAFLRGRLVPKTEVMAGVEAPAVAELAPPATSGIQVNEDEIDNQFVSPEPKRRGRPPKQETALDDVSQFEA